MLSPKDIGWLAGLIEGEGCINLGRSNRPRPDGSRCLTPRLHLAMTDRDVIERVSQLLRMAVGRTYSREVGTPIKIDRRHRKATHQDLYSTSVYGNRAVQWLMTVYVLLGSRRRAKAREIIAHWRQAPYTALVRRPACHPDRRHHSSGLCHVCYKTKWQVRRQVRRLKGVA